MIWDEKKRCFFSLLKNHNKFSSRIIVISFQNKIRNFPTEGHEQEIKEMETSGKNHFSLELTGLTSIDTHAIE